MRNPGLVSYLEIGIAVLSQLFPEWRPGPAEYRWHGRPAKRP
jgi:hypothetical protein